MSYAHPKNSGRRVGALLIAGVFHVALIYALINGLARRIIEVVHPPLETKIIEEVKPPPPDRPPPPPPPKLAAPPPPYIPPPEVQVQVPVPPPPITTVTNVKPPEPVPPPAAPVVAVAPPPPVRTAAVVDARACDKPPYPAASLRAGETGVVQLSFLIDVNGAVLDSKVLQSSGHRRLDEAARKGLGLCKFKPATVDGRPERSWARIEYDWKLE